MLNNEDEYKLLLKNLADIRKINNNNLSEKDIINSIYRDHQKKKQQIIHDVLVDLKLPNIALKQNISSKDLNKVRKLSKMKINDLKKLSKVRNIKNASSFPLSKE